MNIRFDNGLTNFEGTAVVTEGDWRSEHRENIYRASFKRLLDVVLVLLAAPIVLPTILVLAALVSLDGNAPFYRQKRVGMAGRIFSMWKLRTMVPDADARLVAHLESNPAAKREWDAYQKLEHDPRITPLGEVLRKCSFDELPQLWNVLRGDMSLVGPRPMMPEQRPLYPGHAYFVLRPGVTGLWQVSDRNASTFAQRAEFDAEYERCVSLATDVKLLAATVGVVLRGTGR